MLEVEYGNDYLVFYIHGESAIFSATPSLNEWTHVCVTWQSLTGETLLYFNGTRAGRRTQLLKGLILGRNGYFILGQDQDGYNKGFQPDEGMRGRITQFHFWNKVLSKNEGKVITTRDV